ncbi:MAG: SDR family oxidoreductase [Lachnospiraceae bacterium]|nr:SDR family oxidoreductase [Lachnospiraceae bacterium]
MRGIKDKVTIITGSAQGIGKGIATCFAKEGAVLIVADINEEAAKATAKELEGFGCKAEAYKINLCENDEIEAMMAYVAQKYGRIDILVNNAGIQIREWATDFPIEKLDFLMNLNLRAYYLCSRVAARYMKEQEGGGSIVCTSSANSSCFTSKRSPYNISKAAVNGLAATFGVEWGRFGIRINAVAPGYVMTDMVRQGIAEGNIKPDKIMQVIPMKRFLDVEEIGNAVMFLASDDASGITGQTLFVDGGWSKCGLPEGPDGP